MLCFLFFPIILGGQNFSRRFLEQGNRERGFGGTLSKRDEAILIGGIAWVSAKARSAALKRGIFLMR